MQSLEWMESALCTQTDPELFFPEGPAVVVGDKRKKAKAICAWCPVVSECLDYAVSLPFLSDGIWAGLDALEVRRVKRARERKVS